MLKMRVRYNQRSKFLGRLVDHIKTNRASLDSGQGLVFGFDESEAGYVNDAVVIIDPHDRNEFETDLELRDPSRFPARMKAAATALRDCNCSGRYRISHNEGRVFIKPV
jgi:hypothetical protein